MENDSEAPTRSRLGSLTHKALRLAAWIHSRSAQELILEYEQRFETYLEAHETWAAELLIGVEIARNFGWPLLRKFVDVVVWWRLTGS